MTESPVVTFHVDAYNHEVPDPGLWVVRDASGAFLFDPSIGAARMVIGFTEPREVCGLREWMAAWATGRTYRIPADHPRPVRGEVWARPDGRPYTDGPVTDLLRVATPSARGIDWTDLTGERPDDGYEFIVIDSECEYMLLSLDGAGGVLGVRHPKSNGQAAPCDREPVVVEFDVPGLPDAGERWAHRVKVHPDLPPVLRVTAPVLSVRGLFLSA